MYILSFFRKLEIDIELLLEVLTKIVGLEAVENIVKKGCDRRDLIHQVANEAGFNEKDLIKRLAKKLKMSYLENVTPVNLTELNKVHSLSDFSKLGICPIISNNEIEAYACAEPSLVPFKAKLYLASWDDIKQALLDSEECLNQLNLDALQVLELVVQEAKSYGACEVKITFKDKELFYDFITLDKKHGQGEITETMRFPLFKLLKQADELQLKQQKIKIEKIDNVFKLSIKENNDYVLIIDQNKNFLNVLSRFLRRLGFRVKTALNLKDIFFNDLNKPLAIISDVNEEQNYDALKESHIPLIFLSNEKIEKTSLKQQTIALKAGATAILSKKDSTKVLEKNLWKLICVHTAV